MDDEFAGDGGSYGEEEGYGYEEEEGYDEGEGDYIEYEYNEDVAVALYEYEAEEDGQLSFYEGDAITILERREGGWWFGELNGERGLFSVEYTDHAEEVEAEEAEPAQQAAEAPAASGGGSEKGKGPSKKEQAMAELARRREELEAQKAERKRLQESVEILRLRKEAVDIVVEDMLATRCAPEMLTDEIAKLTLELIMEESHLLKLITTRQNLHDQLHSLSVLINRDVKKGNPLEPFKASLLDKLNAFATKLTQDTTSRAVYEKHFKPFLAALQELEMALENQQQQ